MHTAGSMVVAKSEERVRKIEAIQERRMKQMLSQSIETLDRVEDAHEQFIAKIDRRQQILEEEAARVRTARTAAADKVQQQRQSLLTSMQRDQAELESRLEERQETADFLVQQATKPHYTKLNPSISS
jgi:hypothetical protein